MKNGVKNIQTTGYNGARTSVEIISTIFLLRNCSRIEDSNVDMADRNNCL